MYGLEQRRVAIETFIKFGYSYADTIAELGYPNRQSLRSRWNDYREHGEVRPGKPAGEPRFPPGDAAGGRRALSRTRQEPGAHHAGHGIPEEQGILGQVDRRARPGAEEEQAGNRAPQREDLARGEDPGRRRAGEPGRGRRRGRRQARRGARDAVRMAQADARRG